GYTGCRTPGRSRGWSGRIGHRLRIELAGSPGRVELLHERTPVGPRPQHGVRRGPYGLLHAPDQLELAIAPDLAQVKGPPGVEGVGVNRHHSLGRVEALSADRLAHLGDGVRPGLLHSLRPELDAVVRRDDRVAGRPLGAVAILESLHEGAVHRRID